MAHFPQRLGEPDCRDFLRTGRCKYGDSCKYHHPLGGVKTADPNEPPFPIRPDEPLCQYFLKNGTCKFGQTCKFHHPAHMVGVSRNQNPFSSGGNASNECIQIPSNPSEHVNLLPQRSSEPDCIYFLKHGRCKYGSTCKYHHPSSSHIVPNNPPRYFNNSSHGAPLYKVPDRERSASGSSAREIGDGHTQGTILRGSAAHIYQPIEHRRVVDSVPHRLRQGSLDTISNAFQPYPQNHVMEGSVNHSQHRFHANSYPEDSKMSASYTSSTLASSFDTAVSNVDKMSSNQQLANIRRSQSGVIQHSRSNSSESALPSLDIAHVSNNPSSYETSRISNVRHYPTGPPPPRTNNHLQHANSRIVENNMLPSGPGGAYIDQSKYLRERPENRSTVQQKGFVKNSTRPNVIDDGLSMMTSALLTMMDTPASGPYENADTISTHSSIHEDNGLLSSSSHGSPFVSRSLPEFSSHPLGNEVILQRQDQPISRAIGPRTDNQFQLTPNQNYHHGFHSQPQLSQSSESMFLHPFNVNYPNSGRNGVSTNQQQHGNSLSQMNNNLAHGNLAPKSIAPGGAIHRRPLPNPIRNPNSNTVGSVPTQFFMAP